MDTWYWALEYVRVFFAYVMILFVWPSVVFRDYLRGRSRTVRFAFCVTVPVVLLHILQRMISPAWTKELLLRNLHFSEALAPLIFSCRLYCTKEPSAARTLKAAIDAL